jgi:hypothetical protein
MQGKLLRQVLDKMMTSGHAQNARVQVLLPDGKYYDITSLQLLENKLIGVRETHRLVFTVQAETWNMGKVVFDACLKVPKLYEGSCIRDLVARGLKLEPKESGFKDIEKFLSLLGA